MKENLKNGDNVRLRKNVKIGGVYGGFNFLKGMMFSGSKQIDEITSVSCRIGIYYYPNSILIKTK